ncbi:MAG: hypothetical protein H5T63_05615 [Chloroflexi bacterium]|nr:hypothetical protein [Chloroflexota bacterium]
MKKLVTISAVCFSISLAAIVGVRMSAESMAVVVGIVCGVAASIPMSAVILFLMGKRSQPCEPAWHQQRAPYPPVVVIQGGSPMRQMPSRNDYYTEVQPPMMIQEPQRQFRIIGSQWAPAAKTEEQLDWKWQ